MENLTEIATPAVSTRNTAPLEWSGLLAQQGYVLGVDISGGGERVVLSDVRGNILGRESYSYTGLGGSQSPEMAISRVTAMMDTLLGENEIRSREVLRAGVGFGGPVDARHGTVRMAHDNPSWENFPLAERIEAHLGVPTLLDNDARLAALGEVWFGDGANEKECHLVYIHWSTGIGGGIVAAGKLLRGATTTAGEIGHTVVRTGPDALPCRCGGRGHLEAYAGASALLDRANALGAGTFTELGPLLAEAGYNSTLQTFVEEAVSMMSVTIGNLITSLNPELVVIGGRVAREAASLIPLIGEKARAYAMPVSAREVQIAPAALGEDATVMGAVALALDSLR